MSRNVVVVGTQWGDEGKGKLVDILAAQYEVVARAQVRVTKGAVRFRPAVAFAFVSLPLPCAFCTQCMHV